MSGKALLREYLSTLFAPSHLLDAYSRTECYCRFHMFFNELPNNTSNQLPLILVGFGFTAAQSALFNIAKPLIGVLFILISAWLLYSTRLGTGYTCALSYLPCIIGGIIEVINIQHLLKSRHLFPPRSHFANH